MDVPFLEDQDFYLRELRETDLDGHWYSWFNDSEVTKYQNKKIFPNNREKQKIYYETIKNSTSDVVFAIIEKKSNTHIGNVGLHHIDWVHRSAELGIVIGEKDFWGKGFGKKAWKLITEYGFMTLNLHRIYAIVMTDNISSVKSAEASGFKKEGTIREVFYKNGKYLNIYYYNITREDFNRL
jgi:[ribosomal protein S5]-alanine N-acetyltransferase